MSHIAAAGARMLLGADESYVHMHLQARPGCGLVTEKGSLFYIETDSLPN